MSQSKRAMLSATVLLAWRASVGSGAAADVKPVLPSIPDRTFQLADFGAVGDGKTPATDALRKAIKALSDAGGGRLEVPAGTFLTLPFQLTSHMDLHLAKGAVIQFPKEYGAYGLKPPAAANEAERKKLGEEIPALISGDHLSDIAITGEGVIDGGGALWWNIKPGRKPDIAPYNGAVEPDATDPLASTPATEPVAAEYPRPKLLIISNSQRLHFDGVTFQNSPMYHLVPTICSDVLIENLHVTAPGNAPNTDAIDPMGSHDVLIRNCDLDVGDDNVAVKAIPAPTYNIRVEDCRCLHGHGISIGSETYKGIHDVSVARCSFEGTANGIRIKSARDRGNDLYNFDFSDITMHNVGNAITINLYYNDKAGSRARAIKPKTASTPMLHGVHIWNVKATLARVDGDITGLPESNITDISLTNVSLQGKKGLSVHDSQVIFDNVNVMADKGESVTSGDATITTVKH